MPSTAEVMETLSRVNDPELRRNIVELNMVRDLKIGKDGKVEFTLALTIPGCPLKNQLEQDARLALMSLPGVNDVRINFRVMSDEERARLFGQS
jgi:ATP-binding protein involved in chromosome partitioning